MEKATIRGRAISDDLRIHIGLRIKENKYSQTAIAKEFKVAAATITRIKQSIETNGTAKRIIKKRKSRALIQNEDEFRDFLVSNQGLNAIELRKKWNSEKEIQLSLTTMKDTIKRVGFSYKKISFFFKEYRSKGRKGVYRKKR
jgi:transposase